MGLKFIATGAGLPEKVLTNADLEKIVATSDQWITERTGIKERRVAAPDQATSDLAVLAARQALESAKWTAADLDLIVVATCTPDHLFPSTACLVQKVLGASKAAAYDVSAACSGFMFALTSVAGMVEAGVARRALVIGADTLTRFTDWKDRGTCVLFGDGAGALLVEKTDGPGGFLSAHLGSDGASSSILTIPGGGSRHPLGSDGGQHSPYIHMEGKEVFKHAVLRMIEAADAALKKAGLKPNDLALFIPHQANLRIIDAIAKRMDIDDKKVFRNVHKYGNMSAATTIIALDEAVRGGLVKRGDLVELVAFGAGLTWGAAVLRW
jgi:3-oxoacyl-[acyl-carrier-protein] synthase-3